MDTEERVIEWTDGFILGDGHIKSDRFGALAKIGCKYKEWASFSMSGFSSFRLQGPYYYKIKDARRGKEYDSWQMYTARYPFFMEQRERWYPEGKKWIPPDVRATPTSLLLWYLGDGSLDGNAISIAAYDFTEDENEFLCKRFEEGTGLKFCLHMSKGKKSKLYLTTDQTPKFFDIIGHMDPTGCYSYKFTTTRPTQCLSLGSYCTELGIPHSWATIQVNAGRVEIERVGAFMYPTELGKKQLKEIVDEEYRPRDGSELSTLTQDQVLKELHVHPRRIPGLIEAAGITPHRTPGGQYRFTPEEVDKMLPFAERRKCDPRKKVVNILG